MPCFKHDNNVCACAVSALTLLLVVNKLNTCTQYVIGDGFSDIDFLYDVEIIAVRHCFSSILAILRSFDCITTSS